MSIDDVYPQCVEMQCYTVMKMGELGEKVFVQKVFGAFDVGMLSVIYETM